LTLFKVIIAIYTENYRKPINTKCRVKDAEAGGFKWALND
jgi:hypothetical protein